MKKFLATGLVLVSMNVFSQSFLILNNGVTLTSDTAGFIYDLGRFTMPNKVSFSSGQFFIQEKKLTTVDTAGFFYDKEMEVKKLKGKGLSYFINDDNHLVTVDSKGFVFEYDKDDKIFKKTIGFGGKFFMVKPDDKKPLVDLYTLNDKGNYFKTTVTGLNPADITLLGGAFFQTKSGVTYTISKDGMVFPKTEQKVAAIKKAGGNFFIDSANNLFTVSQEGFLILPILPANIKVSDIQKIGSNYMLDSEGRIFVVDKSGVIFERTMSHDLRKAKVLSL
jgi:hypothetical protein